MKYFIGIILAFSFLNAKAQIDTVILDGVIASVGDNIILLSEVEERYRAKDIRNDDDRCKILDELLTENVLLVQAELDSILVADEELEAQLDARIEQILRMMNYDRNQFISYYEPSTGPRVFPSSSIILSQSLHPLKTIISNVISSLSATGPEIFSETTALRIS